MSAEFMTEYPETAISSGIERMEKNIRENGSTPEYLIAIQKAMSHEPVEKAELYQLMRVARFVAHTLEGDNDSNEQAVYNGELLGLLLINFIQPSDDTQKSFRGGFSQSFLKNRLDKSRPRGESYEGGDEHRNRLFQIAESIRTELTPPTAEQIFDPLYEKTAAQALDPLYETFGAKLAATLTDTVSEQQSTMVGFRLVISEALHPSLQHTTAEVLNKLGSIATRKATPVLRKPAAEKIPDEKYIRELEWDSLSGARKKLLTEYIKLALVHRELANADDPEREAIISDLEEKLNDFNTHNKLFEKDEYLNIYGDLFAIASDTIDGKSGIIKSNESTDIRGYFGGIKLVEVPSDKQLRKAIMDPELYKQQGHIPLVLSIAVRIVDPLFIHHTYSDESDESKETRQDGIGISIDIPLSYKNVTFQRLRPQTFEELF